MLIDAESARGTRREIHIMPQCLAHPFIPQDTGNDPHEKPLSIQFTKGRHVSPPTEAMVMVQQHLQGRLAHNKPPHPETLVSPYLGPHGSPGGGGVLMSEVPL